MSETETKSRTIGEILKGLGRITETEVETALEHQRAHGGYFGEALVACGFVSEEEIEFGLASQFDLPYVFPDADAVDLEAAALVTPEWALEHLTLPIVRTKDALTVVLDSPLRSDAIDELERRSGLRVELGLASPHAIRELVRQVYARASATEEGEREPLSLENTLDAVLDAQASRFGISVRGGRAVAWWDDHGTVRRRRLAGDWRGSLESVLAPPPSEVAVGFRSSWNAELVRGDESRSVAVDCLADESGREYLVVPRQADPPAEERFFPLSEGIASEIRILARSGQARFIVTTDPTELGHELLPHLPELTLDPNWRSVYVSARDGGVASKTFSVQLSADPESWEQELESLQPFHFDAVTVDLAGGEGAWTSSSLAVAAVAFVLWQDDEVEPARAAGIHWRLRIERVGGGDLSWSLESLDG